jgi:predicted DCC family thiol-disulfide oxidoreductase YuxK
MNNPSSKSTIIFVYDGECPLCQMGASLFKVRQAVGELQTIDARTEGDHPIMQEIIAAQLNLDEGMVVKYHNRLYQGDAALNLMAHIGADSGLFNRVNRLLFRSEKLAKACYPFMRTARNIALSLKGVGKINNLD